MPAIDRSLFVYTCRRLIDLLNDCRLARARVWWCECGEFHVTRIVESATRSGSRDGFGRQSLDTRSVFNGRILICYQESGPPVEKCWFYNKTGHVASAVSKNDEFCIKCEKLCIKNEKFCITNDEFRINNDELWIKNDEFVGDNARRRFWRCRAASTLPTHWSPGPWMQKQSAATFHFLEVFWQIVCDH